MAKHSRNKKARKARKPLRNIGDPIFLKHDNPNDRKAK